MRFAVYHNQQSGGARRALHGFCRELSRRHRLDLYALTTADQAMLADEDVVERVIRVPFAPRPPVRAGFYLNDLIRRRNLAALARVNASVASTIDQGEYDAVLVDADRFTFAPYLLQYLRTPSVHYVHHRPRQRHEQFASPTSTVYQRARQMWHRPAERHLQRYLWQTEVALVQRATRVVANSRFTQSRLREIYGVTAALVPPGVDLPQSFAVGGGNYLLSVGEMETRKGFDFLLEAIATIPAAFRPPLQLVANGGNPQTRRRLEDQAARLRISLEIRLMPSQAELAEAYRNADIFVYGSREEALGLAPLEAMSYRLPVVAVAEGGVLETVRDRRTGYLTARDPIQFGRRVMELLASPGLRSSMGAAGRAVIEGHWTWQTRAGALELELSRSAEAGRPFEIRAATA